MSDDSIRRAYDEVPYRSFAFAFTHPRRLAALARVVGLDAPPVRRCRVLEIGCAGGGNLIPMAIHLPDATFVGIDLSPVQIDDAAQTVRTLGLSNIELRAMDILDVTAANLGTFDYIVAHGLYSWVPREVRERMLRVCGEQLNPGGAACISLNLFPGRDPEMALRALLIGGAGGASSDPATRVRRAREMLALLAQCFAAQQTPFAALVRGDIGRLNRAFDWYLVHDTLAEINEPVFFTQFMERATANGLRFVGDAMPGVTEVDRFPPHVRAAIEKASGGDEVVREQMSDVLARRAFRRCILCRADVALDRSQARAERAMRDLYVASGAKETGRVPGEFALPEGEAFAIPDASGDTGTVLRAVISAWPQSIAVATLMQHCSSDEGRQALVSALVRLLRIGLLEVDADPPPPCTTTVGERPRACPYARLQAAAGEAVTHLRHDQVPLPAAHREVLRLLDGTRTSADLAAAGAAPDVPGALRDLANNALLMATG